MWLTGWQYRKRITIQGQSGAGSGYQVLLKVGESSGASGYDFHVEGHSAIFPSGKNDSGDLRFTSSDGITLLPIWVEAVEGTSPNRVAYVWVKVSDNLDSNVDIYCYYGNNSASNVSNGDDTFDFFDDFEGTALDSDKWDSIQVDGSGGSHSVSNSELTVIQLKSAVGNYKVYSKSNYLNKFLELKLKFPNFGTTDGEYQGAGFDEYNTIFQNHVVAAAWDSNDTHTKWYRCASGGSLSNCSISVDPTNYHIFGLWWISSSSSKFYADRNFECEITTNIPTINLPIAFHTRVWTSSATADAKVVCDWVRIRKRVDPEPSFSSATSEEESKTASSITASNHFKFKLMSGDIDFDAHTFKICLMQSGFTFDKDNHATWSDVSSYELPTGNGYTQGGKTLQNVQVQEDDVNDRCVVSWDDIGWQASGGDLVTPGAIVYDDDTSDDTVVMYIEFDNGNDVTIKDGMALYIENIKIIIS